MFEAMIVNITPAFTLILDLRVQIIFNVARKHVKIDKKKNLLLSFKPDCHASTYPI